MSPIQSIESAIQQRFWSTGQPSTYASVAKATGQSEAWVREHSGKNEHRLDSLAATTGARLQNAFFAR